MECLKEVVDYPAPVKLWPYGAMQRVYYYYYYLCDTAVGCGSLRAPVGGWVRHANSDVTLVGCDTSSQQWEMRCHGNVWMTDSGKGSGSINCTQGEHFAPHCGECLQLSGFDVCSTVIVNKYLRIMPCIFDSRKPSLKAVYV